MLNSRLIFLTVLLLSGMVMVSCSSTSSTTKTQSEKTGPKATESRYPSWYNTDRAALYDETAYYSNATALAADSSQSLQKAIAQAKAGLKSAVSDKMESIRNEALSELGSRSGLDSPKFIISLRNAEEVVPKASKVVETEVSRTREKRFRAFSKVSVDKQTLIKELNKALTENDKAWGAMKESQAFTKF